MKVLVDGTIYQTAPSGGAFVYLNELLPALSKIDSLELDLMLPQGTYAPVSTVSKKSAYLPAANWFPAGDLKAKLGVVKRKIESTIWKVRNAQEKGLVYHSVYYEMPASNSWKMVSLFHDMIAEKFPQFHSSEEQKAFILKKRRVLEASARVIAISEQTKRDIIEFCGFPKDRIDVVPHGINTQIFNFSVKPTPSKEPYLLYVGGRLNHKNFMRFLEAYAKGDLRKNFKLLVVGIPWNDIEQGMIKKWGLEERIEHIRSPSSEVLASLYRGTSAFVYPSLYEGFGMPLLEAMACGAPIVTSRVGSLLEVGGEAVHYFSPLDISSIEKSILEAVEPKLQEQLRTSGLERVRLFSWERTAQLTFQSYQRTSQA
jgi:glycosyltransferase involved in cell wall biosynthesis